MIAALRRSVIRLVALGLAVNIGFYVLIFASVEQSHTAFSGPGNIESFLIATGQPLAVFFGATIFNLGWWASGGALLAAFVIAHRRGGVPGASGDPPAAEAR